MSSEFSTADTSLLKLLLKAIGNSDNETQLKHTCETKKHPPENPATESKKNPKISLPLPYSKNQKNKHTMYYSYVVWCAVGKYPDEMHDMSLY